MRSVRKAQGHVRIGGVFGQIALLLPPPCRLLLFAKLAVAWYLLIRTYRFDRLAAH